VSCHIKISGTHKPSVIRELEGNCLGLLAVTVLEMVSSAFLGNVRVDRSYLDLDSQLAQLWKEVSVLQNERQQLQIELDFLKESHYPDLDLQLTQLQNEVSVLQNEQQQLQTELKFLQENQYDTKNRAYDELSDSEGGSKVETIKELLLASSLFICYYMGTVPSPFMTLLSV